MVEQARNCARAVLILAALGSGMALAGQGIDPRQAWAAVGPLGHLLAASLIVNLIFVAFPFRRRNDLGLAAVAILASLDASTRMPLAVSLGDVAGVALAMLPVWSEKLRAGTRRSTLERRRHTSWLGVPHPSSTLTATVRVQHKDAALPR